MLATTISLAIVLGQTTPQPVPAAPKPVVTLAQEKTLTQFRVVALSPKPASSMFAASLEDGKIRTIDAARKVQGITLVGHTQTAYAVTWSPDGKYILSGDEQAKIFLWDAKTGAKLREFPRDRGHTKGIQSLSFSPDGKQFVSVGNDDVFCVWNTAGGHPVRKVVGEPTNFYGGEFTPLGSLWVGTLKEGIRAYAPKTFNLAATMTHPGSQGAQYFTMNKAGTLGLTCGRNTFVGVWDLKTKKLISTLKGHTDFVLKASFAPNGIIGATSSSDGTVVVWDLKKGSSITTLTERSYLGSPVIFTGDGQYFVTTTDMEAPQIFKLTPKLSPPTPPAPARRR